MRRFQRIGRGLASQLKTVKRHAEVAGTYLLAMESYELRFSAAGVAILMLVPAWFLDLFSFWSGLAWASGMGASACAVEWLSQRRTLERLHTTLETRSGLLPSEETRLRQLCDRQPFRPHSSTLIALAERAFPGGYPAMFGDLQRDQVKSEVNDALGQLESYWTTCKVAADLRSSFFWFGRRALQVVMMVGAPAAALAPVIAARFHIDLAAMEPNAYYCAAATLLAGASLMQLEILRAERKLEAHAVTGLQVAVARALALLGTSGKDPRVPSPAVADALGQVLIQLGRAHAAPEPPHSAEALAATIRAVIPGAK